MAVYGVCGHFIGHIRIEAAFAAEADDLAKDLLRARDWDDLDLDFVEPAEKVGD